MDGCLVINLLLQLVFLIYNSLFNKNYYNILHLPTDQLFN